METDVDFFHIVKLLGEGSYAKVYQAYSVLTQEIVALKCFEKAKLPSDKNNERLCSEIKILHHLNSKFIIKLYEVFQNDKWVFLVLEYVNDQDLLNRLKNFGRFSEE